MLGDIFFCKRRANVEGSRDLVVIMQELLATATFRNWIKLEVDVGAGHDMP